MNSIFAKIVLLALLLFTAGFLYLRFFIGAPDAFSAPTEFGNKAPEYALDLDPDPVSIVDLYAVADGDASDLYLRLDGLIKAHQADLEAYAKNPIPTHPGHEFTEQAIELLVQASTIYQGDVYKSRMNLLINYNTQPDDSLKRIELLNLVANALADDAEKQSRSSFAIDIHKGLFALGARMYAERYSIEELSVALALMNSAGQIARLREEIDDRLTEWCAQYDKNIEGFVAVQFDPVAMEVLKLNAAPGDMAALIEKSDPLWKIQATLALGKLRFTAPEGSDRKAAGFYLKNLQASDDPALRAAANAAMNLTADQLHKMN